MLDEKIKALSRAAAAGGNNAMAGDLLGDLEKEIAQLKLDVNKNKEQLAREHERVNQELAQKATKEELADLEARMMQRLQDMFDQLRDMFPDKEALKKKLAAIEKNVSHYEPDLFKRCIFVTNALRLITADLSFL